MASSLFALIDDIASILDDVALLTKVAAQKTAGVVGDDLALNAQQLAGVAAERELPVVWAVGVGSLRNKMILVPMALLLSVLMPWAITPLLMLGGAYLCFEGFEKLAEKYLHGGADPHVQAQPLLQAISDRQADRVPLEREKIKGAIRTDFVLSAEIIVITLGTVQHRPWTTQLSVLAGVALLMTVGVYGLVAGIVKIDDLGLYLSRRSGRGGARALVRRMGQGLLYAAPLLMKTLAVVGTAAMFMVGGGILLHGLSAVWAEPQGASWLVLAARYGVGWLLEVLVGLVAGMLVYLLLHLAQRVRAVRA
jgi:hypothetical protein